MEDFLHSWVYLGLEIIEVILVMAFAIALISIVVMYVVDKTQTTHSVRKNYPVVGRFRYVFEHLGEFFRQYFFAMDREELPFNRAERSWVYRASKDLDSTQAFGSTRDLRPVGSLYFVNCAYPTLGEHAVPTCSVTIGPDTPNPYVGTSVINISAMSYGALSRRAVLALSQGAKKAGCWLNTGEGGLSPFHLEGGADIIFQIGTAKFGVRTDDGQLNDAKLKEVTSHPQVIMVEIKLSQGAKPGKGGLLPGAKVTPEISAIRGIPVGQDAISPNRHPEIEGPGDLLDMIDHVRTIAEKPVGFKAVLGGFGWLRELFELIQQRGLESAPDFITLDGGDGGTGAAPMSLMDAMGMPLRDSLPGLIDLLHEYGLRDRIKVICSGKLINPAHVAFAIAVGADFVNSARGFMFSLGCIQALQCNKNTCPTGITTHNEKLQNGLDIDDKAKRVANYVKNINYEVGMIAHSCGVSEPRQLERHHVRMVVAPGKSAPLDELWPQVHAQAVAAK